MKRILRISIIPIILLLCIGLWYAWYNSNNFLKGTYTCGKLPFSSISFDANNGEFYYYPDGDGRNEDRGTYSKQGEGKYSINSDIFINTQLTCAGNGFDIPIDGVSYRFDRISRIPSMMLK